MEVGKQRLADDTTRSATTDEIKYLCREARDLKEVVTEQTLQLRLLKKKHDRRWVRLVSKPRQPSDIGASYVSGYLAEWLQGNGMKHSRGAPYRPQIQGKIER